MFQSPHKVRKKQAYCSRVRCFALNRVMLAGMQSGVFCMWGGELDVAATRLQQMTLRGADTNS